MNQKGQVKIGYVIIIAVVVGIIVGTGTWYFTKAPAEGPAVEPIKIGNIHPITGPLAFEGTRMRDACEMAVDEVNKAGGIKSLGGAKVKLLTGDCAYDTEKAASESERLVREGVVAMTGCYSSPLTMAATRVTEREKVPFVISVAVAKEIVRGRGFEYTYRCQPNSEIDGKYYGDYVPEMIKNKTGSYPKNVAIVWINNRFGKAIRDEVKKNLKAKEVDIAVDISFPVGVKDFTTEIRELKTINPEIVCRIGYYRDGLLFYKTMIDMELKPKGVISCADGSIGMPKFADDMGEDVNYIMEVDYQFNPLHPEIAEIKEKYKKIYGKKLSTNAGNAYVSTKVILQAIEEAGSRDPADIDKALDKIKYENPIMAYETIEFDEDGEDIGARATVSQYQNGVNKLVWPKKWANADVIYPIPWE